MLLPQKQILLLASLAYSSFLFTFSLQVFCLLSLFITANVEAEYWINDNIHIENNQQLLLKTNHTKMNLQALPEIKLVQGILSSKLVLAAKADLQENDAEAIINEFNLISSLSPSWSINIGRQKISYAQSDLFRTSLSKNDDKYDALNYSQGLLITNRLGFIEQSVLFNREIQENNKHNASYHYQLNVGIPGYKIGPLKLILQYPKDSKLNQYLIGTISSAFQFPLRIVTGYWQWAFQYSTELEQKNEEEKQQAWQMSFSWLGFIPQHNLGILVNHTDKQWSYSDDFLADQKYVELRYQWLIQQELNLEVNLISAQQLKDEVRVRLNFSF